MFKIFHENPPCLWPEPWEKTDLVMVAVQGAPERISVFFFLESVIFSNFGLSTKYVLNSK